MNYNVADFIIRIKNAASAKRKRVAFAYSKLAKNMANLLAKQGYLKNVIEEEVDGKKVLSAEITYEKRIPAFSDAKIISKPSLRIYEDKLGLGKRERRGLGDIIVSTSSGLMTGKEALKKGLGGELLFEIW